MTTHSTIHASGAHPAVVVGTGFGARVHVPAMRAAGFEVLGLVGTDPERTARKAEASGVPHAFTDLDEAISKTGAVAVTIASTPHTHAPLTLTAVAHGCHVICEKPMAADVAEAQTMIDAAERAGVTHLLGHQFRWQPERAIVARALAKGLIGEPRYLTLTSYMPLVASAEACMPRWWFDEGAGGGWLGAHGSHIIDQVRSWGGEFASLSASLPTVSDRAGGAEDSYTVHFRLSNGADGVLQHTAGAWGSPMSVSRIAGTRGTLWIENGVVRLATSEGTEELAVPEDLAMPAPSDDPRQRMAQFERDPYIRLCEVLRAGVEGRPLPDAVAVPTFHDGVAAMKVMDAIRASARADGARIEL